MSNFTEEATSDNRFDQWLYFIRNLKDFQTIPTILGRTELDHYENSLKVYRDLKGVIDTAFDEGKQEGKQEGRQEEKKEMARLMKEEGEPLEKIVRYTGLSAATISRL